MARVTASVYTSHVPLIGVAMDLGKTQEPYWQPLFAGYEPSRSWFEAHRPDVIVLVTNDHATAFSLDIIPTFAIGCAPVSVRSMIDRRRWPKPVRPSSAIHNPLPSGPRAAMRSRIATSIARLGGVALARWA